MYIEEIADCNLVFFMFYFLIATSQSDVDNIKVYMWKQIVPTLIMCHLERKTCAALGYCRFEMPIKKK